MYLNGNSQADHRVEYRMRVLESDAPVYYNYNI